jgi:uncharacterized repeat protein (TIGR01451 family)
MKPNSNRKSLSASTMAWIVLICLLPQIARAEVVLATSVEKTGAVPGGGELVGVYPGETLRYTIAFTNEGTRAALAGSVVITNPLPEGTLYVDGSAEGTDTEITFSVDGETFAGPAVLQVREGETTRPAEASDYRAIRWTYQPALAAGDASEVSFELEVR